MQPHVYTDKSHTIVTLIFQSRKRTSQLPSPTILCPDIHARELNSCLASPYICPTVSLPVGTRSCGPVEAINSGLMTVKGMLLIGSQQFLLTVD